MQSFAVVKNKNIRIRPLRARRFIGTRKLWQTWVPPVVLLVGIVAGSFLQVNTTVATSGGQAYISFFIEQIMLEHRQSVVEVVAFSFISALFLHLLVFFFSFSCVGTPVLIIIPFLKGAYIGCISGYLYTSLGLTGVLANLLIFFAPQLGEAFLLCVLTTQAMYVSSGLFKLLISKKYECFVRLQSFVQCFVYTSLALAVTSVLSGVLSFVFVPVFPLFPLF